MRLPAFFRVDSTKGYRWYTVGGSFSPYDGDWWLKLGPVSFTRYEFDGRGELEMHVKLWRGRRR